MLSEKDVYFSSDNLDMYLKELAKEFRKLNGKYMPAEVILVGGASILAKYGFREKTYDVDAFVRASSAMKDAANRVGDKYELPNGWFNSDFKNTKSFSPKLEQFSTHYRTYSNIVEFRTVEREYLMAMKLMSGRPYKHDLSDVASICLEHRKRNDPISYDDVVRAVEELYENGANELSATAVDFLGRMYECQDLEGLIDEQRKSEEEAKQTLITFEKDYENILNEDNLEDILAHLKQKAGTEYDDD